MSISNSYELFQSGPQINTVVETAENTFYFYQHPLNVFQGALLDGAARDGGNTTTDVLRPGLLLGKVYSTGKLKEWSPTATDGSQYIFGILDNPGVKMQANGTNKDRFRGTIMVRGQVNPTRLLIGGNASYGISGNANEYLIRAQLDKLGFLLQEDQGANTGLLGTSGFRPFGCTQIAAKTADYTVKAYESGTIFTTTGAGAAVTFTLPATASKGLYYVFYHTVTDQNMTVAAGTASTMVTFNNAAATSVSLDQANKRAGGGFKVVGDGSKWLVFMMTGETQTVTVA